MNAPSASPPEASALPDDSINILESFLQDMDTLDHHQQPAVELKPSEALPELKRPKLSTIRTKKKPSWLRRKHELTALREETLALKAQMEFLQTRQQGQNSLFREFVLLKQWRNVEKQRRQAAQDENGRLQSKVQAYLTQMEALQSILKSTKRERDEFLMGKSVRVEMGTGQHLNLGRDALFNMLEGSVDKFFQERQLSFCEDAPKILTSPDPELVLRCYDKSVGKITFTREQLLPFEKRAIFSAVCAIIGNNRMRGAFDTHTVRRRSSDTYAMTSTTTVRLEGGDMIHLRSIAVFKKFTTPRGFVYLIETSSEWMGNLSASDTWSHLTRERGYFLARAYLLGGNIASGMCQLSSEVEMQSNDSSGQTRCYPLAKPNTVCDVVIPSFRQLANARNQFMENALFDTIRTQG